MLLWMRYKIDPFEFESRLTLLDLQFYIQLLTSRLEEDAKENDHGNKIIKSLVAIRDILNYMSLPEH